MMNLIVLASIVAITSALGFTGHIHAMFTILFMIGAFGAGHDLGYEKGLVDAPTQNPDSQGVKK